MTNDPPLTNTEPTHRPKRGPALMLVVVACVVLAASALGVAVSRHDSGPSSLPRLALLARGSYGSSSTLAPQSDSARNALAINARYHYTVDGSLPTLPTHATVRRLAAPAIDQATVQDWARSLHLEGAVAPRTGAAMHGWSVTGTHAILGVTGTGDSWQFFYQYGTVTGVEPPGAGTGSAAVSSDGQVSVSPPDGGVCTSTSQDANGKVVTGPCGPSVDPPSNRPTDLPSAADARTIAERALRDLGVIDQAWTFEVRDGGIAGEGSTCVPDATCTPSSDSFITSRAVVAHRVIDGQAVEGQPVAGLDWTVEVGDHGTITSIVGSLGSIESVGDYPLRSVDTARAGLADGTTLGPPIPMAVQAGGIASGVASGPNVCTTGAACPITPMPICPDSSCPAQDVTITITGVTIGSQAWSGGDPAHPISYIVPTYHFVGHDDHGAAWSTDVLALTDDALATPTSVPTSLAAPVPTFAPGTVTPEPGPPIGR